MSGLSPRSEDYTGEIVCMPYGWLPAVSCMSLVFATKLPTAN